MYSKFRILKRSYFYIISIALICSVFLTGCNQLYKTEQIKVKIIDIDPPKHFYIFVNVDNKKEKIYISKRCNVKQNLIGSETTITKNTYKENDGAVSYSYSQFLPKEEYCK